MALGTVWRTGTWRAGAWRDGTWRDIGAVVAAIRTIEGHIYAALSTDASVKRLISGRAYPVVLPQNCKMPAVSYQRLRGTPINDLSGFSGLRNAVVEVSAWATAHDEATSLGDSIEAAVKASSMRSLLVSRSPGYDPDADLYRRSLQFSCWGT